MSKEFKNFKDKFSKMISSNEQLSNDWKAFTYLKCEFDKTKEEIKKLLKEILKLKILHFQILQGKRNF